MGVMAFEKEKIEQLGRCYAALDLLEVHNQTLHATQKALTEQMELHERLISIGLDYLSVEPSHICPLCTTPHSSPGELIDKVKSQNLLSELSQENSKKSHSLQFGRKNLEVKFKKLRSKQLNHRLSNSQAFAISYMKLKSNLLKLSKIRIPLKVRAIT